MIRIEASVGLSSSIQFGHFSAEEKRFGDQVSRLWPDGSHHSEAANRNSV